MRVAIIKPGHDSRLSICGIDLPNDHVAVVEVTLYNARDLYKIIGMGYVVEQTTADEGLHHIEDYMLIGGEKLDKVAMGIANPAPRRRAYPEWLGDYDGAEA